MKKTLRQCTAVSIVDDAMLARESHDSLWATTLPTTYRAIEW